MRTSLITVAILAIAPLAAAQTTVFSSDFDTTVPAAVNPGTALLEGVQGYAGLGPIGNQFGGTFLRSPTGNPVTITLTGLPPHDAIELDFLFAAIDSLDGTGNYPSGDFLAISLDGNTFFRESFANALPSQIQSYVAPAGVQLARRIDLGFTGPGSYYTDSAYWLGGDARFQTIGHTASSLTLTFQIEGPGIQPLGDESWAMDNLRIRTRSTSTAGSLSPYGASCGPQLSVQGAPSIGQTLLAFLPGLPNGTIAAGLALGLSASAPFPLPLAPLGAPGCFAHHDAAGTLGLAMTLFGDTATLPFPIPNNGSLVGFVFFMQGWGVAIGVNPLGIVTSNGVRVQLGT